MTNELREELEKRIKKVIDLSYHLGHLHGRDDSHILACDCSDALDEAKKELSDLLNKIFE